MSPDASAPSDDDHNDDDLHTHRNSSPWLREIPVRPLQDTYVLTDRQLGSGGFGTVVVGRKKHLPQHVAVKRIHRDLRFSTSDQRRFVREVQLLAPLQHPNIVRVEDWGRDDEGLYIVMELIDGPNLETFCRQQQQPFSLSQLHDFTRQICSALGWAHQHGIVHRDLKPANLLLLERFHLVKLADFGMARGAFQFRWYCGLHFCVCFARAAAGGHHHY
jgi:serine/threonine protein kinase